MTDEKTDHKAKLLQEAGMSPELAEAIAESWRTIAEWEKQGYKLARETDHGKN